MGSEHDLVVKPAANTIRPYHIAYPSAAKGEKYQELATIGEFDRLTGLSSYLPDWPRHTYLPGLGILGFKV